MSDAQGPTAEMADAWLDPRLQALDVRVLGLVELGGCGDVEEIADLLAPADGMTRAVTTSLERLRAAGYLADRPSPAPDPEATRARPPAAAPGRWLRLVPPPPGDRQEPAGQDLPGGAR
jgi:hypothetical protein